MFGRKKESEVEPMLLQVPILCKFTPEDGVWNATAEHLPIAVFGETFEQAAKNMNDAIMSHLAALSKSEKADEVIEMLREKAREFLPIEEITPDSPIVKMLVAVKNREFMAISGR